MDLVERYLATEATCRRSRRPGDISAELHRLLLARLEGREAMLRRPLRTDEAVSEFVGFSRGLLVESRAVMRRLEDACLGPDGPAPNILHGGSHGPR